MPRRCALMCYALAWVETSATVTLDCSIRVLISLTISAKSDSLEKFSSESPDAGRSICILNIPGEYRNNFQRSTHRATKIRRARTTKPPPNTPSFRRPAWPRKTHDTGPESTSPKEKTDGQWAKTPPETRCLVTNIGRVAKDRIGESIKHQYLRRLAGRRVGVVSDHVSDDPAIRAISGSRRASEFGTAVHVPSVFGNSLERKRTVLALFGSTPKLQLTAKPKSSRDCQDHASNAAHFQGDRGSLILERLVGTGSTVRDPASAPPMDSQEAFGSYMPWTLRTSGNSDCVRTTSIAHANSTSTIVSVDSQFLKDQPNTSGTASMTACAMISHVWLNLGLVRGQTSIAAKARMTPYSRSRSHFTLPFRRWPPAIFHSRPASRFFRRWPGRPVRGRSGTRT